MDDAVSINFSVPDNLVQPLLVASSSPTLNEALNCLTETAKTNDGRSTLALKRIIVPVIHLCEFLSCPLRQDLLLSSLKLLRNLCAGEISNQNLIIEQNGVGVLSEIVASLALLDDSRNGILGMLLQVLGNVLLAGEEHQVVVWRKFFSSGFLPIARVRSKETCDPLCMVISTCSGGSSILRAELKSESGLEIVKEIIRTATLAGFTEDWLNISRICLEDSCFSSIFSELFPNSDNTMSRATNFVAEHAFLLRVILKILNEQAGNIVVSSEFVLSILGVLRNAVTVVDFTLRATSNLPTTSPNIDVMGYSLTILRDICANDENGGLTNTLVLNGLIELLVTLLRDLEPPATMKNAMVQSEGKDGNSSGSSKFCPYKGFRRDVVVTIGNCCYRMKNAQDKIREVDGIVLLLQHCIVDEENPFLREWGVWAMRNVLEGNTENSDFFADLELKRTVDVPELTQMGLRVEVDPKSKRAKLVNISGGGSLSRKNHLER